MDIKPSGIVTFLFTDIEGSTKLAQDYPETLQIAMDKHHSIMQNAIESNNGFIFEIIGDAFCAAFENADDAVNAAVDAQLNLSKEKCLHVGQAGDDAVIKVRIGIHSGNAEWSGEKYIGYISLARTARVMSAAYGEQVLISNDAYILLEDKLSERGRKISFRDLGERRLKDVIQPIRLYQIITSGLREDFSPLKTLDARPNNLPVQLTSFIGREEEMKQIKNLLKQTSLLTLTGPGGTGKTRLAMQVAADVIDDFANGVWFVELDSLHEPELLPLTIMQALGIPEQPKQDVNLTLSDYLKDKELLLILDNCEHIIRACSKLAEQLLQKSPKLKILATSRESLRCSGEQTFKTLSMTTPDLKVTATSEQLTQYESVRLFIERAIVIEPKFRVTNENIPAIAGICSQLDGIPLAIELAAVRINILPVEKIYERLSDRFKLLTGGKRTSLKRQQTLRALIDWSFDLLSESEKILWRRVSVFSGGWTLESAEEICFDENLIKKEEILELLNNLTDKSIVIFKQENNRFRMLETIKQYGEEKLKESNEYEKISDNHLRYYERLAETADGKLRGNEAPLWLKILDSESGNVEKGLRWSIKNSVIEDGMRLAGAMGYFWRIRGYITEGIHRLEIFMQKKPSVINSAYCKIVSQTGYFMRMKGDLNKAKKLFKECLQQSREIGFISGITDSINGMGLIEFEKGRYEPAAKLYEENLNIYYETNDKSGIAYTLNNLGTVALELGDVDKAFRLYEESLTILREIEDVLGITRALNNLGVFAYEHGEYSKAIDLLQENLKFNREIGNKLSIAITLNNSGIVAYYQGEYEKAADFYNESLDIYRELGEKHLIAFSLINLGSVKLEQGQIESALKLFVESYSIGNDIGAKLQIALSLFSMGRTAFLKKQYEQARKYYLDSLALYIELGSKKEIVPNILRLAELQSNTGYFIPSAKLLGFVKNYFEFNKSRFSKSEQNTFDKEVTKLKAELKEEFDMYFEEGEALTVEEAINSIINVQL